MGSDSKVQLFLKIRMKHDGNLHLRSSKTQKHEDTLQTETTMKLLSPWEGWNQHAVKEIVLAGLERL